ncbi:MAG TPA: hypothetical protein VF376_11450 [Thermoanaerobaculia bacterium]
MNPAASSTGEEASRPTFDEIGLRRAAAATDGEASPVGICDTDEIVWPQRAHFSVPDSTSEAQLGQRIKWTEWYQP